MPGERPDFLICGASRSGTTLLWHLLNRHPDLHVAGPVAPEPKFFARERVWAQGFEWYCQEFFPARSYLRLGEKSTAYMDTPRAAPRIAHYLPAVRLIFLLREPGLRAWSNWKLSRRGGLETLDFATALAEEEHRTAALTGEMAEIRPFSYLARSRYAEALGWFRACFAPEQMFVARYEDLVATPEQVLSRLHRFLEVPARPEDGIAPPRVNEASGDPAEAASLAAVRAACAESTAQLVDWYGPAFAWPEFS